MPWRYRWIACLVYSHLWLIIRKTEFILKIKYWKINKWNCSCMFLDCSKVFHVSSSLRGIENWLSEVYLFCRLQVELHVVWNCNKAVISPFSSRNRDRIGLLIPIISRKLLGCLCDGSSTATLSDSFGAAMKIIPDRAPVHTQERLWRRDFSDGAKTRRADLENGASHLDFVPHKISSSCAVWTPIQSVPKVNK